MPEFTKSYVSTVSGSSVVCRNSYSVVRAGNEVSRLVLSGLPSMGLGDEQSGFLVCLVKIDRGGVLASPRYSRFLRTNFARFSVTERPPQVEFCLPSTEEKLRQRWRHA